MPPRSSLATSRSPAPSSATACCRSSKATPSPSPSQSSRRCCLRSCSSRCRTPPSASRRCWACWSGRRRCACTRARC
jgi:hypothetical protein